VAPVTQKNGPINVAHSMHAWLPQTMAWLYTQVSSLPDSIESHIICDEIQNLDQYPIENILSADQDTQPWRSLGARSWQVRKWRQNRLLRNCIRETGAQVLHSHFGDRGWSNVAQAAKTGLKHVVTFYGYDVSRLPQIDPGWRERYRTLFETADLFLCEGPYLRNSLVKLGWPAEKAKVHHLGANLQTIDFKLRNWEPGEPLRVLIAGSFVEKKGIPIAIEALGRIKDRVELEITIIGDANPQERSKTEKGRILDALNRNGLERHTRLLGYQPYSVLLAEGYRSHLFLSPSIVASDGDSEGGAPVSIIEMAASGMPVVSSTHCDIPEVLEDGVTGLLADEGDVDGLVQRLDWLLDHPDEWARIGSAARHYTEQEFDARTQGKRLAQHYQSLFL